MSDVTAKQLALRALEQLPEAAVPHLRRPLAILEAAEGRFTRC